MLIRSILVAAATFMAVTAQDYDTIIAIPSPHPKIFCGTEGTLTKNNTPEATLSDVSFYTCRNYCLNDASCLSFSWTAAGACTTYTNTLAKMGLRHSNSTGTFLWSVKCWDTTTFDPTTDLMPNSGFENNGGMDGTTESWDVNPNGGIIEFTSPGLESGFKTTLIAPGSGGPLVGQYFPTFPSGTFQFSFDYIEQTGATGCYPCDYPMLIYQEYVDSQGNSGFQDTVLLFFGAGYSDSNGTPAGTWGHYNTGNITIPDNEGISWIFSLASEQGYTAQVSVDNVVLVQVSD